jgi:hypothetical protein
MPAAVFSKVKKKKRYKRLDRPIILLPLCHDTGKKIIGVNSIKFNRQFQTDEDYYRYLSDIKWEAGYR